MSQGLTVTVRLGEVDTIEYQRDRGLAVTVYFGKRKGSASTADLAAAAVRETVEKACAIARYTAEDPYAGLAEPEALAREIPDLDLDHPWDLPPERAIELARECEAAGLAVDARISNSEGGSVNTQRSTARVRQLARLPRRLLGHQPLRQLLADRPGTARTCSATTGTPWRATRATWRAPRASGAPPASARWRAWVAQRLTTRKAPVVFTPEWRAGCSGTSSARSAARSQYRKSSFLLDAAGEQIFPKFLAMQERPHILKGLASSPFDDEGVATRDRELVRDGVLDGYVLGSYSARQLGLKTTGNAGGIHNLIVSSAEPDARRAGVPAGAWAPGCWSPS